MGELFDLVGVSGFEPEASWTRTKRDTKLRHTPIPMYYKEISFKCQVQHNEKKDYTHEQIDRPIIF